MIYPDGWIYEGSFVGGQRSGYGVLWTATGTLSQAGYWSGDQLTEAMKQ
jgi:hypothetical protein